MRAASKESTPYMFFQPIKIWPQCLEFNIGIDCRNVSMGDFNRDLLFHSRIQGICSLALALRDCGGWDKR